MAGNQGAGRGASRVTRAGRGAPEGSNPGPKPSRAQLAAQTRATPGRQAAGATKAGTPTDPAGRGTESTVRPRPGRGVQDQSSAATGQSIFDRADAGNRRLGQRNRT